MRPKVSTIFITYQERPRWLAEAFDSVLRQEGVDLQVIVATVVGDPAVDVALKLGLEVCACDHAGIYYQINSALPLVQGDWYVLSGGNDVLLPTKFIHEVEACQTKGGKVCYSDMYQADERLKNRQYAAFRDYSYAVHMTVGNIVPDDAMLTREVLEKYKPFRDDLFGEIAIYDFWLRIAEGEGEEVFVRNARAEYIYRCGLDSQHVKRRRNKKAYRKYKQTLADLREYHRVHCRPRRSAR